MLKMKKVLKSTNMFHSEGAQLTGMLSEWEKLCLKQPVSSCDVMMKELLVKGAQQP